MNSDVSRAIRDVRGKGLMVAIEFDQSVTGTGFAQDVTGECFNRGVLTLPTGVYDTIRIIPPLNVTKEAIDEFCNVLEKSIVATLQNRDVIPTPQFNKSLECRPMSDIPSCDTPSATLTL